jgi:anti-sigma regulatory factor (Ser/Thr protein kinase)
MSDVPTEEALARSMNAGLLPQAFPFRREVEFAGARHGSTERICFYDDWWPDSGTVCFVAASLASGGVAGVMAAASLRHLLRAAIGEFPEPGTALASCGHLIGRDTGLAAAVLDLRSGVARTAAKGSGALAGDPAEHAGGRIALRPGTDLWIGAGPLPAGWTAGASAGLSPAETVAAIDARLAPGAVLGLIRFKGAVRQSADGVSETISLTNENGEVAEAIARMEKFRERAGIGEDAFAGMDLAVDEILTNVISYAFRDGDRHRVDLELDFSGGRLRVEIRDDGVPFNPLDIPAPKLDGEIGERDVGGLGMHFVRNIADDITYRREANWNILTLSKNMGGT